MSKQQPDRARICTSVLIGTAVALSIVATHASTSFVEGELGCQKIESHTCCDFAPDFEIRCGETTCQGEVIDNINEPADQLVPGSPGWTGIIWDDVGGRECKWYPAECINGECVIDYSDPQLIDSCSHVNTPVIPPNC